MADLFITVSTHFEETEADCSQCYCCGDIMVGKMYNYMMQFNDNPLTSWSTEINICQSCHNCIEND
jgi:hypothetical protein